MNGLRKKSPASSLVRGFDDGDLLRSARKDLRPAYRVIGSQLEPEEELVNSFKLPPKNQAGLCYLFLTSTNIRIAQMSGKKETFALAHEAFLGIRMSASGWVRLAYRNDSGEPGIYTFFFAGERPEVLTFYAQLAVAWSALNGREWRKKDFLDAAVVPVLDDWM
jgi:hypothetical protein